VRRKAACSATVDIGTAASGKGPRFYGLRDSLSPPGRTQAKA